MIAILSDIHANLEALEAVLADAESMNAQEIICLGDLVGYGPDPCDCVKQAMSWNVVLQGNFDYALLEVDEQWPPTLLAMIDRLRDTFECHPDGKSMISFMENCPTSYERDNLFFVHGSPRDHLNEYVFPEHIYMKEMLQGVFDGFRHLCFCGHSHIPGVHFHDGFDWKYMDPSEIDHIYRIKETKVLCNVGSVGQPRDGDPRACYVLIDDDVIVFRRVDYDFGATINKIRSGDDDDMHGARLPHGR